MRETDLLTSFYLSDPLYCASVGRLLLRCTVTRLHIYIYIYSLSVSLYVHIYIYIYIHIHTYIHTCIHTYILTYIYIYIYIYTYIVLNTLRSLRGRICQRRCSASYPAPTTKTIYGCGREPRIQTTTFAQNAGRTVGFQIVMIVFAA